jgi:hypothetical protein
MVMSTSTKERMTELMVLIDKSIELTDNQNEMLMLACAMMQRTNEIFTVILGEEGKKLMYKDMI